MLNTNQILEIEKLIWETADPDSECEPIIDGIINLEEYNKANLRIMWILKEPYDDFKDGKPFGGGWHFGKDFLNLDDLYKRIGKSHSTWHPIIYVTYGILNNFIRYEDMPYIRNSQKMVHAIRSIAFINVKKTPGFTRTGFSPSIPFAYNTHKVLLHQQIELYNPHVIIGGSTLHLFYEQLGVNKSRDEKKFNSCEYVELPNRLLISAYHPGQTTYTRPVYVNDIIRLVESWNLKQVFS